MEPLNEDDPGLIGPYRVDGVLGEGGHQSGGALQRESAYVSEEQWLVGV